MCLFLHPQRKTISNNIHTATTGQTLPCLQQTIEKTRYFVEVLFSATSTQSVDDRLKRVILHDLKHGKHTDIFYNLERFITSGSANFKTIAL